MILSLVAQVSNSSNASMNIPPYYVGQASIFSCFPPLYMKSDGDLMAQ